MCEFEEIAVEVVAIPFMSGLRVTPCDVKAEGQAGENAAAPSGFLTSAGSWQGPEHRAVCVLSDLRGL